MIALPECPECGKEIGTQTDVCPYCGYPLYKNPYLDINTNPDKSGWLDKYKKKPVNAKIIQTVIFLLNILLFVIFLNLYTNDYEINEFMGYVYYESKVQWFILTYISGFSLFLSLCFEIAVFTSVKTIIERIDGYDIVVYAGVFRVYLVIENVIANSAFDSAFHNLDLSGTLPNRKKIYVRYSRGAITIDERPFFN